MASQLPHTTTGAPFHPYRLVILYPPIGSCFFFLSCISVSLSVCFTCRSAPELYFVLSTFRADLQFMYINTFSFSLRIHILLPLLLCPCLALDPRFALCLAVLSP